MRLRRELRYFRAQARLTQREIATTLDWSISKIIRIESGQVGVSATDLKALLDGYGVTDADQVRGLLGLARQSRRQAWSAYRDVLNPEFVVYLGYESVASRLDQFEPMVVPGLLQTPGYAEALIDALSPADTPAPITQRRKEFRAARGAAVSRTDGPRMRFVLDEGVLHRRVGEPGRSDAHAIWVDQLRRLVELDRGDTIDIVVLPFTHGSHHGLAGPFVVLGFDDPDENDVLFQEFGRPNLLTHDKPRQVDGYRRAFEAMYTAGRPVAAVVDEILADPA